MRIQNILNEDFTGSEDAGVDAGPSALAPTAPKVMFSDLSTLQIRTLQRIADGAVDVDTASEKEYDIMADLVELGLLDNEYQMTKRGQAAVYVAKQKGGSAELLDARRRAQALGTGDAADVEVDVEDDDSELPVGADDEDEFTFDVDTAVEKGQPTDRGRLNF